MSSPTAPIITSTGISAPNFAGLSSYLIGQYASIFGTDVVLSPDTQDGQLVAIFAQALSDVNSAAIACYQSFSPVTAVGTALSVNCAINGIQRATASNSTVALTMTGVANTVISNGVVTDTNGYQWTLPSSVVIGTGGTVTTTGTCTTIGAIAANANTVTTITTPTLGWQSVTNPAAAALGQPVQTDAQLRQLQAASTTVPSLGVMDGIVGALWNLPGVTQVVAYDNPTSATNSNGIPSGAIALVVEGGNVASIAQQIALKKGPGIQTYGSTSQAVNVAWSTNPLTINFSIPTQVSIRVAITLNPLTNYTATIGAEIQTAVANYINSLAIGTNVMLSRLYVPAQLAGSFGAAAAASPNDGLTFEISSIQLATATGSFAAADIAIAWNQIPVAGAITITT